MLHRTRPENFCSRGKNKRQTTLLENTGNMSTTGTRSQLPFPAMNANLVESASFPALRGKNFPTVGRLSLTPSEGLIISPAR